MSPISGAASRFSRYCILRRNGAPPGHNDVTAAPTRFQLKWAHFLVCLLDADEAYDSLTLLSRAFAFFRRFQPFLSGNTLSGGVFNCLLIILRARSENIFIYLFAYLL